mmetsp:Transcript_88196/g.273281  ORF Transcript_88196/g.273281 Transcript_88196/m.273281 type:complete len:329 (+) Transcript_88196:251-1237(+)
MPARLLPSSLINRGLPLDSPPLCFSGHFDLRVRVLLCGATARRAAQPPALAALQLQPAAAQGIRGGGGASGTVSTSGGPAPRGGRGGGRAAGPAGRARGAGGARSPGGRAARGGGGAPCPRGGRAPDAGGLREAQHSPGQAPQGGGGRRAGRGARGRPPRGRGGAEAGGPGPAEDGGRRPADDRPAASGLAQPAAAAAAAGPRRAGHVEGGVGRPGRPLSGHVPAGPIQHQQAVGAAGEAKVGRPHQGRDGRRVHCPRRNRAAGQEPTGDAGLLQALPERPRQRVQRREVCTARARMHHPSNIPGRHLHLRVRRWRKVRLSMGVGRGV